MPLGLWADVEQLPNQHFGYPKGTHGQNKPLFFVDHIMAGPKSVMDSVNYRTSPSGVSAHFGIGKDGRITQYVSILDASYANGIIGCRFRGDMRGRDNYDRSNRHLAALLDLPGAAWSDRVTILQRDGVDFEHWSWSCNIGVVNVWNSHCISIEHEGQTGETWTAAMLRADIAVKRWCNAELVRAGLPPIQLDKDGIIGHMHIDSVDRPNCPGTAWDRNRTLAFLKGDVMIRHNAVSQWYEDPAHQSIAGDAGLQARGDFGLPVEAVAVELEILTQQPGAIVMAVDGRPPANAPANKGYAFQTRSGYGHGRVNLEDGWLTMRAANVTLLQHVNCVGYYIA